MIKKWPTFPSRCCDFCRRPFLPIQRTQRFCRPRCCDANHNAAKAAAARLLPAKTAERLAFAKRVREAAIRQEPSYHDDT